MDPALFRIDWEVLAEVLTTITVLAFFVERALSLLFEHRFFVQRFNEMGIKEPIAFLVSLAVVRYWNFDALGILMHADKTSWWGYLITAAIVAGGSKASIKLFHDVLKTKSKALTKAEAKNKSS
jgi:hypothetical protein